MADTPYILGIDLGTKKVAALLGQMCDGEITLCGIGLAPSDGVRRGEVVDLEKASAAIASAVAQLESSMDNAIVDGDGKQRTQVDVPRLPTKAWVGITGDHVRCFNPRAEITLSRPGRTVSPQDVEEVLRKAIGSVSLPNGHEVIHVIARSFAINVLSPQPQKGLADPAVNTFHSSISNPVGMTANRLAVQAHVVSASAAALGNIERCVERAGLAVEGVVLEPIASADAVLSDAERDLGVALIDIGAGTTDIAIFVDGGISFTGALPIGGSHITRDLAVGLEISVEDAEKLKLANGCALVDTVPVDEYMNIMRLSSDAAIRLPRRYLAEIIQPRAVEMLSLAKTMMVESGYFHRLPVGAVLSGGGALLEDLLPLARQVLGIPVRLGRPITKASDELRHPSFATGVGLLLYGSHEHIHHPPVWNQVKPNLMARLSAWWKQLFGP